MKNFLKKLAYYDGSEHLKKSLAQGANMPANPFIKRLILANKLMSQVPAIISKINSQKDILQYLLGKQAKDDVFNLVKKMSKCKVDINHLNIAQSNEAKPYGRAAISRLDLAINKILRTPGDVLTDLLNKGDQENLEKLSNLLKDARGGLVTPAPDTAMPVSEETSSNPLATIVTPQFRESTGASRSALQNIGNVESVTISPGAPPVLNGPSSN
jgi:hypothetical protein